MTRPTATATLALCAGLLAALLAPTLHVPAAAQPLTQGGWVCDAYDQSAERGRIPQPDAAGHTFPILTIHGITGTDADFAGTIDLSYSGTTPSPPRSLLDALAGIEGQDTPPGLPHAHVYSFSYTDDSLRWLTDDRIAGRLAATIDCLHQQHGVPVSVVAHSMGGLVTRYVANTTDPQGVPRATKLGQVVTLGTPYLGSDLAAAAGAYTDAATRPPGVPGLTYLPALDLLLHICGNRGTDTGDSNCWRIPQLAALESDAGRALRAGSPQLAELGAWPATNTLAIAASTQLRVTLFGAPLTTDLGDIVVSTPSATADATRTATITCTYDLYDTNAPFDRLRRTWNNGETPQERNAQLRNLLLNPTNAPCYHGNLMRNTEITTETLGTLNDWITTNATTTGQPPQSGRGVGCVRSDIEFAAVRNRPTPDGDELGRIPAGTCGVEISGSQPAANLPGSGAAWFSVSSGGVSGLSAARLFDVASLPRAAGLTAAVSQIGNFLRGGEGGPVVNASLQEAERSLPVLDEWSFSSCRPEGSMTACSWDGYYDVNSRIDVYLSHEDGTGWTIADVWALECSDSCGRILVPVPSPTPALQPGVCPTTGDLAARGDLQAETVEMGRCSIGERIIVAWGTADGMREIILVRDRAGGDWRVLADGEFKLQDACALVAAEDPSFGPDCGGNLPSISPGQQFG